MSNTWTFRPSSWFRSRPALIPFLEHDDANRALMGSNMQRQGVPLIQHRFALWWEPEWKRKWPGIPRRWWYAEHGR
jgi:hypothetical protein